MTEHTDKFLINKLMKEVLEFQDDDLIYIVMMKMIQKFINEKSLDDPSSTVSCKIFVQQMDNVLRTLKKFL